MSTRAPAPDDERATALEAFWRDLHQGRLLAGPARLVPLGLAVGVAAVAVLVGDLAAGVTAIAIAIVLVLASWRVDRPRWHAQDVVYWLFALRSRRWVAETGGPSPVEQPGRAETWLAVHPRGSVPQLYRAIAASQSGDPVLAARELAALEVETPLDRARLAWLRAAIEVNRGERPDLVPLRALVAELPAGPERAELDAFLAQAEAIDRHAAGDPGWLDPLITLWPEMRRVRPPMRSLARLWLARLGGVAGFLLLALILGSVAPSVFSERIPAAYAETRLATRGDVPAFDQEAVVQSLPGLARAVAGATRARPDALDEVDWATLVDSGLPTLIWDVGAIDVAAPADAPGTLWQVEVRAGAHDGVALLTFDGATGPVFAYKIDPAAVARVAAALGAP